MELIRLQEHMRTLANVVESEAPLISAYNRSSPDPEICQKLNRGENRA
jgi:hypothetical protein